MIKDYEGGAQTRNEKGVQKRTAHVLKAVP